MYVAIGRHLSCTPCIEDVDHCYTPGRGKNCECGCPSNNMQNVAFLFRRFCHLSITSCLPDLSRSRFSELQVPNSWAGGLGTRLSGVEVMR